MSTPPKLKIINPERLDWRGRTFRCVLGKGGRQAEKREGDGATPIGQFPLRRVYYRPDMFPQAPPTGLPTRAIRPEDGWCDDPSDPQYNRLIRRPFTASHEQLWRKDRIYDLIIEVGYNDNPPVSGRGSAIFIHIARPDFRPTEGCVALRREDLLTILKTCDPLTTLVIPAPA